MQNLTGDIPAQGPVLLLIGASWCRPCQAMTPLLEKLADAAGVPAYKIDGEERDDLRKMFNVSTFPTTVLLKDSNVVDVLLGGKSQTQLVDFLELNL